MNEQFAPHAYTRYFFTVTHCLNDLNYSIDQMDSPNKSYIFFFATWLMFVVSVFPFIHNFEYII